jgi:hypothetical protein
LAASLAPASDGAPIEPKEPLTLCSAPMRTGTFFASASPPVDRATESASTHPATDLHARERNPLHARILVKVTFGLGTASSSDKQLGHPDSPRWARQSRRSPNAVALVVEASVVSA